MALVSMLPSSQQEDGRDGEESRGEADRLSDLPDHILLCILERLRDDVRLLGRTCVLSKRWKTTLPSLMLPELDISFRTFLPADRRLRTRQLMLQATDSLTGALRFFLAAGAEPPPPRAIITSLRLRLCLIEQVEHMCDAAQVAGDAITRGDIRDLELVVYTEKGRASLRASPEKAVPVAQRFARRFMRLLVAAPAAAFFRSVRVVWLQNLWFDGPSDVGTLLDTCKGLERLTLDFCGFVDPSSAIAIDAPQSQLKVLCLEGPRVGRVDVIQAPRLVSLTCSGWMSESGPVTFGPGSAPCLKEITLNNRAETWQRSFSLSELLENVNHVQNLRLGFGNDKIWVHPESPKTLGAAFGKLKIAHLMDVFPEGDLSWTMFLLQAAPLLEFVDIEVYDNHACCEPDEERELHGVACWELPPGFRHRRLRELHVGGGIGAENKDVAFARLVMELLVLDARVACEECVAAQQRDPSVVLSRFPEDEDGVDEMVSRIKDGVSTCARILVYFPSNRLFEYV